MAAPVRITDLTVVKSGNNTVLSWSSQSVTGYKVYRGTTPDYITNETNLLDTVTEATYTDTDALLATTTDYYYRVTAYTEGTSAPVSNMGFKKNFSLVFYEGETNNNFISLPYIPDAPIISLPTLCTYVDVSNLIANTAGWINPHTDLYLSGVFIFPEFWAGDEDIVPEGFGNYLGITDDLEFSICGSHDDSYSRELEFKEGSVGGIWVSLPYHHVYLTASDLGNDIPNCTSVAKWDGSSSSLITCLYPFSVNNFDLDSGSSYQIFVSSSTSWKPKVYSGIAPKVLLQSCMLS